jgi:hypothetical protein
MTPDEEERTMDNFVPIVRTALGLLRDRHRGR